MDINEIYKLIKDAKESLKEQAPKNPKALATYEENGNKSVSIKSVITESASQQYYKCANRIFGIDTANDNLLLPSSAEIIIAKIKESKKKSTLRKYARSVRHVSMTELSKMLKLADMAQRKRDWIDVERIVTQPSFKALTTLAKMLPSDYTENWQAESPRKGKKPSLLRLPKNWREQMVAKSEGQFTIPMVLCMLTGCRPSEVEKGIVVKKNKGSLYVYIKGAKVKANAGQKFRAFKLAKHHLTNKLIEELKFDENNVAIIKVDKGNSISTHMRMIARRLWPNRKESITTYSARHAMAAECKQAVFDGANPDMVSEVLGHVVDKTATYYGNRSQSGGLSVAPNEVKVPTPIRRKSSDRTIRRTPPSKNRSDLTPLN